MYYSVLKRLVATGIDFSIICILVVSPSVALGYEFVHNYGYFVYLLSSILFVLKDITGRSIGKKILNLKIIYIGSFSKIPILKRVIRNITFLIWPIELIIIIVSQDHQRLSDRVLKIKVQ